MEKSIIVVVAGTARVVRLAPGDHADVVNVFAGQVVDTRSFPLNAGFEYLSMEPVYERGLNRMMPARPSVSPRMSCMVQSTSDSASFLSTTAGIITDQRPAFARHRRWCRSIRSLAW